MKSLYLIFWPYEKLDLTYIIIFLFGEFRTAQKTHKPHIDDIFEDTVLHGIKTGQL